MKHVHANTSRRTCKHADCQDITLLHRYSKMAVGNTFRSYIQYYLKGRNTRSHLFCNYSRHDVRTNATYTTHAVMARYSSKLNRNFYTNVILHSTRFQPFYGPLIWADSLAARGKITTRGIPNRLNCCEILIVYTATQYTKCGIGRYNTTRRAARDSQPAGWKPMF